MNKTLQLIFICLFLPQLILIPQSKKNSQYGFFELNTDIGNTALKGTTVYNSTENKYIISGSGENMWFDKDEFQYVWKKVSGNISISADISWIGNGVNPHRKAGIVIRQNLSPGSVYVDAVIHGDGLTSLQYRENENSLTKEIQSNFKAPQKIILTKAGDYFYMTAANENNDLRSAGGSCRVKIEEPFYVGFGVCSHDNSKSETAVFSNVEIKEILSNENGEKMLESSLEIIDIESKNRKVIFCTENHIEAPNWFLDGNFFIYNSNGLLYKIPIDGSMSEKINTGFAVNCNNDHGLSPDNSQIVISDQTNNGKSQIYILPVEGGTPKLITPNSPSYWHGWSPDGKTLVYCAERGGNFDVYSISVNGGDEVRLTNTDGLDDGPEFSPDGKYIYFNSIRTGKMQIWRMNSNGSDQRQITNDDFNNWFPHPSPDGKYIVFLTYERNVEGHPANKDVMLRIMSLENGEIQILTKLFGGQGTINVPSWSPDSKKIAFISYREIN